jgi:hypothetical protein
MSLPPLHHQTAESPLKKLKKIHFYVRSESKQGGKPENILPPHSRPQRQHV